MIDWSTLQHAYGEASNVPRLLDALASDDEADRNGAFYDFYGCLCHQGTVYTASLAAIPALLELLARPSYPDRARLLQALAALARGYGEGVEMAEVRVALARGSFVLDDSNEADTLHTLSIFAGPEFHGWVEAAERVARKGLSARVRARAWEAVGAIAPARIPDAIDDEPVVALIAHLCKLAAKDASSAVVDSVARGLADRGARAKILAWQSDPFHHCEHYLKSDGAKLLTPLCAAVVDAVDGEHATSLAGLLLRSTFIGDGPPVNLALLTEAQRDVLAAVVEADAVWMIDGAHNLNLLNLLASHGLPFDIGARDELRAALGVPSKKRVVIVLPRQVSGAREEAIALGREAWLDAPFVFTRGDKGDLEAAIPEDPADFPPEVMADFESIEQPIVAMVLNHTCPVESAAFYPQLSAEEFEAIARRLDFEIVAPNLVFAEEPFDRDEYETPESTDDDDEGTVTSEAKPRPQLPPCIPFAALPPDTKERLSAFVDCFDEAGFSEVRNWYRTAQEMSAAGVQTTPLALARRFGSKTSMNIAFHCDESNGEFLRAELAHDGLVLTLRFPAPTHVLFAALSKLDLDEAPSAALVPLAEQGLKMLLEDGETLHELTRRA